MSTVRSFSMAILAASVVLLLGKPGESQMVLEGVRKALYAGSWYEADPDKLRAQLQAFLASARPPVDAKSISDIAPDNPHIDHPILALVAPHAGYAFSGRTAAYAYNLAAAQKVKRIFLFGPSHQVAFHGAALPMQITFQTPLGDLEVDKQVIEELKGYPIFSRMPEVHRVEHSLEMQLPFIRQVFGEVKIVPIVIGILSDQSDIRLLAEILKGYVSKDDLVVVSSDFTHYGPRYQYQPFSGDRQGQIRKLDGRAFQILSSKDLNRFLSFEEETKDTICGFYPCCVLAAMLPESARGTLLKYATSQDSASEDKDNSVSYLSIAFSGGSWPEHPGEPFKSGMIHLSQPDRESLLKLARGAVEKYVRTKQEARAEEFGLPISNAMKERMGVFVTLNKSGAGHAGGSEHELRGCIGYIWPLKPLYQAVIDNAVSASSRDYRFNSVQENELKDINIEISVLTPPRRIKSYHDIALGRDGIVLFKNGKQAVFLPAVPAMFGWDLPQTLAQLAVKAGLEPDDWRQGAQFDVFQADVFEERK